MSSITRFALLAAVIAASTASADVTIVFGNTYAANVCVGDIVVKSPLAADTACIVDDATSSYKYQCATKKLALYADSNTCEGENTEVDFGTCVTPEPTASPVPAPTGSPGDSTPSASPVVSESPTIAPVVSESPTIAPIVSESPTTTPGADNTPVRRRLGVVTAYKDECETYPDSQVLKIDFAEDCPAEGQQFQVENSVPFLVGVCLNLNAKSRIATIVESTQKLSVATFDSVDCTGDVVVDETVSDIALGSCHILGEYAVRVSAFKEGTTIKNPSPATSPPTSAASSTYAQTFVGAAVMIAAILV